MELVAKETMVSRKTTKRLPPSTYIYHHNDLCIQNIIVNLKSKPSIDSVEETKIFQKTFSIMAIAAVYYKRKVLFWHTSFH